MHTSGRIQVLKSKGLAPSHVEAQSPSFLPLALPPPLLNFGDRAFSAAGPRVWNGTICRRISDSRTWNTAVSDSRRIRFYLGHSGTKAQCESPV